MSPLLRGAPVPRQLRPENDREGHARGESLEAIVVIDLWRVPQQIKFLKGSVPFSSIQFGSVRFSSIQFGSSPDVITIPYRCQGGSTLVMFGYCTTAEEGELLMPSISRRQLTSSLSSSEPV